MSKSFVLTHRYKPDPSYTLGVDNQFLRILDILYIDVTELSQEDLETFQGIVAVHGLVVFSIRAPISEYVLRYM